MSKKLAFLKASDLTFTLKKILEAIYEPRFLNCMYGFRPKRGCHEAVKEEKMKEQLFSKDSVIPQEVCFIDEKMWHSSFGGSNMFYDVRPDCLEPYISRYVRIINRCGMKTFYSCDGWHRASHKSREMVIIFEDRYSWIWHKIICEQLDYVKWEYGKRLVRISLPHHDSGKLCIYEKVNNAAELFENNCSYLKSLKRQVIDSIEDTSIYIDIYSDEEVEDIIRNAFITVFTGQK